MPDLTISLATISVLWNIGLTVVVWLRKPGVDAGAAVAQLGDHLKQAVQAHAERLAKIETAMQHMPDSEELAKLEGMVLEIKTRAEAQTEQLRALQATMARIEGFLLNNKRQ